MKPPGPKPDDAKELQSLRVQFEAVAEELSVELFRIAEWLARGAAPEFKPTRAFTEAPDHMNECRFLLGEIQAITQRAERA